jgi:hypothetical protein
MRGWFRDGLLGASFGSHPLFELLKCVRRSAAHPFLVGSIVRFAGYLWWRCSGRQPLIPADKVTFLRSQQMAKIGRQLRLLPRSRFAHLKDPPV